MRTLLALAMIGLTEVVCGQESGNTRQIRDSLIKRQLYADTMPKKLSLTEIIVRGKKPPVEYKVDRQVFNASAYVNAANGNAIELIRNFPGVAVNGQGDIQLRGSSSFQVLVNGRPTQGEPAFILAQFPANSIDRVEIISTPGAAFDADGKSGILNIITKSAPQGGWIVQTNLMQGAPTLNDFNNQRYTNPLRQSADISAGFRKGNWDISSGFNYLSNDMSGFREGDVYTINNGTKTSFPSNGERSFRRYNYGGRLAVNFQVNENNSIEAGFYTGYRFQSRVADLLYDVSRISSSGSLPIFRFYNENTANKSGRFTLVNFGSHHKLSNELSFSYSLQYEGADLSSLTTNFNYNSTDKTQLYQETQNPGANPLHAYRYKADLTHKKGNRVWQTGYQFRYDIQRGDFVYQYRNGDSRTLITDPQFTSKVNLQNNIHAGYLQYGDAAGQLSWQAGLRAEHMLRRIEFSGNIPASSLNLLNLFPSYLIRYQPHPKVGIKQSFTRRIKRTNNFELNPFPEREHTETLERGDPELLPELTGTWELAVEHKLPKGSFSLAFYHQRIKNPIQRVNNIFNDTILNRIFTNAGVAKQTGAEASLTIRPVQWWQVIAGGNIYRYSIKGELFNGDLPFSNSSWVFSLNTTQSFAIPKNWSVQWSFNYLSIRATAQGEDGAFIVPNLSVKKSIQGGRWTFQAQWLNMDAGLGISNRQRITTRGLNFYSTTNYIYEPDQVQFSASFNLTKNNRKLNLPASEMAEKEF
jgi:outer membrane receptor protein involved in Fe transport